jgi:hypothetical protein
MPRTFWHVWNWKTLFIFICFGTPMTFLSSYVMVSFKTLEHGRIGEVTWGARNVLCRRNNLHIVWNWKQHHRLIAQLFVGRCWWPRGCLWLGGSMGLSMVGLCGCYFLRGGVSRLRGPITHHAPTTPNFPSGSNCEIVGDYVHK